MKLNLLFIMMELLTVLAYPLVYMYGKLHSIARSKESVPLVNILSVSPVAPDRFSIGQS